MPFSRNSQNSSSTRHADNLSSSPKTKECGKAEQQQKKTRTKTKLRAEGKEIYDFWNVLLFGLESRHTRRLTLVRSTQAFIWCVGRGSTWAAAGGARLKWRRNSIIAFLTLSLSRLYENFISLFLLIFIFVSSFTLHTRRPKIYIISMCIACNGA